MAAKKKQTKQKAFDTKYLPVFAGVLVAALVAAIGIFYLDPTYAEVRSGQDQTSTKSY